MRSIPRTWPRTDADLLADAELIWILELIAAGRVGRGSDGEGAAITDPYIAQVQMPIETRTMHRLAAHELIAKPISGPPCLAPRGTRLLQIAHGELPTPVD